MISIENLTVEFGDKSLFQKVSYVVSKRDRISLVGKNGAGKSTMLKIIAGLQQPSKGNVSHAKDMTIGYLPQHMIHSDETTVIEEAGKAFEHISSLQDSIDKKNQELCERTDYESDSYTELINDISDLNEHLTMLGGGNFQAELEKTLLGLGFLSTDMHRSTKEFSGGWRMRIELAKILLASPDLLLLDEPTNHLDLDSIQWLENFLKVKASALILISHDRAFLDAVANRTIEISVGKIYDYRTNYSKYVELRKERKEQQIRAYLNQQKEIKDTEDFIERFRYKTSKAVQVQSRIKQLNKIERIEIDEEDNSRLRLKFFQAPSSGAYPVIMEDVGKYYGNHCVYDNVDLTIERGEKVAFVGKNGEGKTTMVKCIMQELEHKGKLQLGHNVKIGYFAQNQASLLDGELTVFDTIDQVAVGDVRTKIRDILGAFMFGGEASDKKVKVLSGGERSRLAMIRLLLEPVNLLILDEPTNHLDMQSKDILKQALLEFNGTAILVSHDREFLDGLVSKVYAFGGARVKENLGGIQEFLAAQKLASLSELEQKSNLKRKPEAKVKKEKLVAKPDTSALSYEERKARSKKIKKAENKVNKFENTIIIIEQELQKIEDELAAKANYDPELYNQYEVVKKKLSNEEKAWEDALGQLDKLNSI